MRKLAAIAVVLLVLGAGAWSYRIEILLALVERQMDRRVPVGPHRAIEWASGADPLGRAPAERPPNVVVILADDLGWNDLTANGGGVAGGSVPTPAND